MRTLFSKDYEILKQITSKIGPMGQRIHQNKLSEVNKTYGDISNVQKFEL